MDTLKDVAAVQNALSEYKTAVTSLKSTTEDLTSNKEAVSSAWMSSNSDELERQYQELIGNLSDAYVSLEAYQAKIDAVVQEIVGFDETLNK